MKTKRTELYDTMNDIYDAYYSLWYGTPNGLSIVKNQYYTNSVCNGGLRQYNDKHVKYDFTKNGNDLKSFIEQNLLSEE